jgi:D-beta-D-heptose 7-phosphate kinase/D-beta-D-heptose 1-phosphate adenosyltransferase
MSAAGLSLRRLEQILADLRGVRLLVVGDVVLDEYLWGEVDRVSPEAPVPVVHVQRESLELGGAGNVVRNAVELGARCEFCAAVGDDRAGDRVVERLEKLGVDPAGIVRVPGRPTTRKTRVIARSQQMVRFDRETTDPMPPRAVRALLAALERVAPRVDGVVIADYAKGLLTRSFVAGALRRFAPIGVPRAGAANDARIVAVDPKSDLSAYRGASLVKPNVREAEALSGIVIRGRRDLERAGQTIRRRLGGAALAVTRGASGMTLFADDADGLDVATPPREVFDVQGAGDTAIAALTLALRAGGSLLEAAVLANAAAGVVVGKIGTATARPDEVRELLPAALAAARGEAP